MHASSETEAMVGARGAEPHGAGGQPPARSSADSGACEE